MRIQAGGFFIEDLSEQPFAGLASSGKALHWRQANKDLIHVIHAVPEKQTRDSFKDRMEVIQWTKSSLYGLDADPQDRTDLIKWVAQACVAWNNTNQGGGLSMAHVFCGKLMQAWGVTVWYNTGHPLGWRTSFRSQPGRAHDRYGANTRGCSARCTDLY